MYSRASYRTQLALAFGLLALLAPLALGALVGERIYSDLRVRSGADVASMARQMTAKLDRELNHVRARTRLLARSVRLQHASGPPEIRRALSEFQQLTPEIAWAGYANSQGVVVAATGGLLEGVSIRERPVFREATQSAFLGGLHPAKLLERHLGEPDAQEPLRFLDVSVPVRDPQSGRLQGVIATHIDWQWARDVRQRMLDAAAPTRGLSFAIVGRDGEVLLGPGPPDTAPADEGLRIASLVRKVSAAPDARAWQLIDLAAREDIVASVQHSQVGLGWRILAWQPAASAFAPAQAAWRTTLAFSLAAGLLAGLAGWFVGRRLGAPVLRLAQAAQNVRDGHETRLPAVAGPRELASLAGSLDDLLAALRRETELQRRNLTLQHERAEAERASRAKSIFLANMNHELRTPLNAVLGFAQMMRLDPRTPLPEAHAERARQIERAGQHLVLVINDVLTTAQAEAGELEVRPQEMDLAAVLRESLELVRMDAQEAGVALPAGPPADRLPVIGDPLRVRQILINLLTNAIKYNERGGAVEVSVERLGDRLQLAVSDDGPGVDPARVEQLFEPFNRGEAETAGRGGIGLGLPLSRMLAERMDGTLSLANRDQGGAVARLTLPAVSGASGHGGAA